MVGRPLKPGVTLAVGLLPGVTRTAHLGPITSNTNYGNKDFVGSIDLTGLENITFTNCDFDGTNVETGAIYTIRTRYNGGRPNARNIRLINCRVTRSRSALIYGPGITADKCELVYAGRDAIKPDESTAEASLFSTYRDCWFHVLGTATTGSDVHADAFQWASGGYTLIERCNFDMPYPGSPGELAKRGLGYPASKSNAIMFLSASNNTLRNVTLKNSWVNGGNYGNYAQHHNTNNGTATLYDIRIEECYYGLENAFWAGNSQAAAYPRLHNSANLPAGRCLRLNNYWDLSDELIIGAGWEIGVDPGGGGDPGDPGSEPGPPTVPPTTPPSQNPNWRRLVLRVS